MGNIEYVFAIVNYQNVEYEEYTVIYIAPKSYWDAVGDLRDYKEVTEGELQRTLSLACGDDLNNWDIVHWYSTKDKEEEELKELLTHIGMEESMTLKEYADAEIQEFGDKYIEGLY